MYVTETEDSGKYADCIKHENPYISGARENSVRDNLPLTLLAWIRDPLGFDGDYVDSRLGEPCYSSPRSPHGRAHQNPIQWLKTSEAPRNQGHELGRCEEAVAQI